MAVAEFERELCALNAQYGPNISAASTLVQKLRPKKALTRPDCLSGDMFVDDRLTSEAIDALKQFLKDWCIKKLNSVDSSLPNPPTICAVGGIYTALQIIADLHVAIAEHTPFDMFVSIDYSNYTSPSPIVKFSLTFPDSGSKCNHGSRGLRVSVNTDPEKAAIYLNKVLKGCQSSSISTCGIRAATVAMQTIYFARLGIEEDASDILFVPKIVQRGSHNILQLKIVKK